MHMARPEVVLQPLCHRIQDFEDLLRKQDRVLGVVEAEAQEVAQRFGRDRRTMLTADTGGLRTPQRLCLITLCRVPQVILPAKLLPC